MTTFTAQELPNRAIERRSVEAAIWGMPLVNVDAMRQAYFRAGAGYNDCIFWSNPNTWMNQTTTPNHSTSYVMFFINLKAGPVVVDVPAAAEQALYGTIINVWNEPLLNLGNTGYDNGKGANTYSYHPISTVRSPTGTSLYPVRPTTPTACCASSSRPRVPRTGVGASSTCTPCGSTRWPTARHPKRLRSPPTPTHRMVRCSWTSMTGRWWWNWSQSALGRRHGIARPRCR